MFANHKIVTAIGSIGAAVVLGHVVLGPDVVPPSIGLPGAAVAAAAGIYLGIANKRARDRAQAPMQGGPR